MKFYHRFETWAWVVCSYSVRTQISTLFMLNVMNIKHITCNNMFTINKLIAWVIITLESCVWIEQESTSPWLSKYLLKFCCDVLIFLQYYKIAINHLAILLYNYFYHTLFIRFRCRKIGCRRVNRVLRIKLNLMQEAHNYLLGRLTGTAMGSGISVCQILVHPELRITAKAPAFNNRLR